MNWFFKVLSSSIGKKFVMGITGLLLCGFLVVHLAGNLLLFANDGGKTFNLYAETIHSKQQLVYIAEAGLLALFLAHIYLAFTTNRENRIARRESYAVKVNKYEGRPSPIAADTWMFVSGAVILAFVLLHLVDIRLEKRFDLEYPADAGKFGIVVAVLQNPISRAVYIVGSIFLGFHLLHGFTSAFQSLGMNHPKYNKMIKIVGAIFAIVIGLGFASLPIFVDLFAK